MFRQNVSLADVGNKNSNASANSEHYNHVKGRAAVYVENKNDREIREFSDTSMTRREDGYSDRRNSDMTNSSSGYLTAVELVNGQATPSDREVTHSTTVFSIDQGQNRFMNCDNNFNSGFNNINQSPTVTTSQNVSELRESDLEINVDSIYEQIPEAISNDYVEIIQDRKVCM